MIVVKVSHLIEVSKSNEDVTNKKLDIIMATLQDFQVVVTELQEATKNISSYVQGTGMSAADQDAALKAIQEAATNLVNAIPKPAVSGTTEG